VGGGRRAMGGGRRAAGGGRPDNIDVILSEAKELL
jgi:hypothetical protein